MKRKRFIYLIFGVIGIIFLSGCKDIATLGEEKKNQ